MTWQRDPLLPEARQWFYGSGLYHQLCAEVTGKPWTDPAYLRAAQQAYAERWLQTWRGDPPFAWGRWLDYGGSTGVVSRAWAQDPAAELVVADYGDGATVTPEDALTQGPYDAVLCCQTLDHLAAPLETLKAFHAVTRDGGTLFVDVVKGSCTAFKVDHDTYWPTASAVVGCVERAGWTVDWVDAQTDPAHWAVGAHR